MKNSFMDKKQYKENSKVSLKNNTKLSVNWIAVVALIPLWMEGQRDVGKGDSTQLR